MRAQAGSTLNESPIPLWEHFMGSLPCSRVPRQHSEGVLSPPSKFCPGFEPRTIRFSAQPPHRLSYRRPGLFIKAAILKTPNHLLSRLHLCARAAVARAFPAVNVGPSLRLLPSRQTRPACCPLFSTSIISTPVGWVGRRAIGGCSSPRRWNSLRPSTIASEAEQPPVWADCGEGAQRFRDFPTNCSLCTAFGKTWPVARSQFV